MYTIQYIIIHYNPTYELYVGCFVCKALNTIIMLITIIVPKDHWNTFHLHTYGLKGSSE